MIKTRAREVRAMYLVLGILGNVIQSCYMQLEFTAFAEFSKACSKTDEVWTSY
jgi:hypothetical protein